MHRAVKMVICCAGDLRTIYNYFETETYECFDGKIPLQHTLPKPSRRPGYIIAGLVWPDSALKIRTHLGQFLEHCTVDKTAVIGGGAVVKLLKSRWWNSTFSPSILLPSISLLSPRPFP